MKKYKPYKRGYEIRLSNDIHEKSRTSIDVFSSVIVASCKDLGVLTHDDKFQTYLRCIRTEKLNSFSLKYS